MQIKALAPPFAPHSSSPTLRPASASINAKTTCLPYLEGV